jgi:hypothetical protein
MSPLKKETLKMAKTRMALLHQEENSDKLAEGNQTRLVKIPPHVTNMPSYRINLRTLQPTPLIRSHRRTTPPPPRHRRKTRNHKERQSPRTHNLQQKTQKMSNHSKTGRQRWIPRSKIWQGWTWNTSNMPTDSKKFIPYLRIN